VDRGADAAGDLGQANNGGAILFVSPDVSNDFNVVQTLTYGCFDTEAAMTTLNTGQISQLGGGKLLVNYAAGGLGDLQSKLPSYDTVNADAAYSFSRFQLKLQVFNLFDKRQTVNYVPSGNETGLFQANGGFYTYQSGREIQLTLVGKFL